MMNTTSKDKDPVQNNTARLDSHLRISERGKFSDPPPASQTSQMLAKLTADERQWVERHPNCWREQDTTPAPEPETGQPHDHFSFGHESEYYGTLNEPEKDADGNDCGWLADAYTPAELEGYSPTKPDSQRERLNTVENAKREGESNKANAEGEALKPVLRHAIREKTYTDPVLNEVVARLSGENLQTLPGKRPHTLPRRPMNWTMYLSGRDTYERNRPQIARARRAYEQAEAKRQADEYAEAMRRPPLVDTKHAADILGVTPSAVRHWAKTYHITITKVGSMNYYRLSDVLYYAASLMEPAQPDSAAAA